MDIIDRKILKAINKASPKSFISPVKVNEILKMDVTEFGNHLMLLKKSGHVDILISDYPSSLSLPTSQSVPYRTGS
jgi:DNA-binding Lrp family transcriptional regulator